jgi:Arabinose-binding domain of AraC transcription regulator, N-term
MACSVPDRIKVPQRFWSWLQKYDLAPTAALRHAHLPLVAYEDEAYLLTTAQFFTLWRSIGEMCPDPAFGLTFASQVDLRLSRWRRWRRIMPAIIETLLPGRHGSINSARRRRCGFRSEETNA